ncbi:hypothetical protein BJV82DRAFT_673881 [Fennellomyces sp. T-0311]|nr:hypothetical protein BJV82DRAFT_673881 [Fennellomyces sp. T-0311]
MLDGAHELKRRSPRFLSKDGFTAPADLHVSVGSFDTNQYRTRQDLCHVVHTLVNDPNSLIYCSLRHTFELKLDKCTHGVIRMVPTNWYNPVATITDVFRNTLVDHHFIVKRYSMDHMTVFKGPSVRGMSEPPLDLGFVPDFGPLRISSVMVSDYVPTLTGRRSVLVAGFVVDH